MRTLLFIIAGFFVYFLLLLTTQRTDRRAVARVSLIFIGLWFVVATGNMWYGVTRADSLAEEVPIALLIAAGDPGGDRLVQEPHSYRRLTPKR